MPITFYDIQGALRCLWPKPLDVEEVLRLNRLALSAQGEAVPNMRLVDWRTLEEVTGHILEEDEPHIVCCEGGDDLAGSCSAESCEAMLTDKQETERKARDMAHGLGIPLWVTADGRIVQTKPRGGGTEIVPPGHAKPTPHGAPTTYGAISDGG